MNSLLSKNREYIKMRTNIWIESKIEEQIGIYQNGLESIHNIN
jgi:hypothetical protein